MKALEKYQKSAILILVVLSILLSLGTYWGVMKLSDTLSFLPSFLITAMVGILVWGLGKNIEKSLGKKAGSEEDKPVPYVLNPVFRQLQVYYYRAKGAPSNPDFSQVRYLVDFSKDQAYQMHDYPDWLEPYIKGHQISWVPYDEEKILKREIQTKFTVSDLSPLPHMLGLKITEGFWVSDKEYSELLDKLAGHKLEGLQIARLERRHFFSIRRRTLLVDFNEGKVWLAPLCWFDLIQNGLIDPENYGMRFYESCERWSKRRFGFKFISSRYPDSLLIAKGSATQSTSQK